MDSLGIGAMPDAASYGDAGTDTLGHISDRMETLHDAESSEDRNGKPASA